MPMMPPRPYPPSKPSGPRKSGSAGRKTANAGSPLAAAQRQIISSYAKGASSAGRDATTAKRVAATNASKSKPVSRGALPPTPNRGSRPSTTRPTRGGGSFAGDLAEFGRAVNRGKAGASSKGKQIAGRMTAEDARAQKARPTRGGGSKPATTRMVGGLANKIERAYPVKAKAPRPTRSGGSAASGATKSSRAEDKSLLKTAKGQTALKARLKTVDYAALGKAMKTKGLPKTK